ncbi:MAG TPA: hypothetical protein PLO24_12770 [Bacteroidales bacterium]|nr:hypothetical protein [Bacteroidales bacterium]HOS71109.1 hypothetical protein [Bacteroidales bacterium]HQH23593.1 hypothetical protein [Bacteroidales bacterium]HQJ81115.1 hypothetical protein [Bacteroidales bacterium]
MKKNIEGTRQYLQLAADIGAIGILVFPNALPREGDMERKRILEQIGKSVSELATFGYNLGVQLRLEEQFNLVKGRIGNVHLRELFTGDPWRKLFNLLSESGYEGYCDIELSEQSCELVRMMKNYRVGFLALQNAL